MIRGGTMATPVVLAIARIGLGMLFLIRTAGLSGPLSLFPAGRLLLGWPDTAGPGLAPLLALPSAMVAAACVARTLAAGLFTLGVWTRPAGIAAGLIGYVVVAQDPLGFNMTVHTLLLGTIILACTDAGSRIALLPTPARSPHSSVGLVRIWIASIYVWAGMAKLHADWMSGRVLAMLLDEGVLRGIATSLLAGSETRRLVAISVAMGEILLGVGLLLRPTRRAAVVLALGAHALFQATLTPDLFGAVMVVLLVTFVGDIGSWRTVFARASHA
jgi:hypothetical protein